MKLASRLSRHTSYWTLLLFAVAAACLFTSGCAGDSKAKLREKNAFLAGQNTVLMQQQAQADAQTPGVTIIGAVQHPHVPWVAGLTLSQAITTANYIGADDPKEITITHNGQSATIDAGVLLNGTAIPLEIGDTVELH